MLHDADAAKLRLWLRLSIGANVASGLAVLVLGYGLLIFVVDEPAEVEGVSLSARSDADGDGKSDDPRAEMRAFFTRTAGLLDRAARRHGTNPADVLPTREQIDAAVESRSIHSMESEMVLQKLREGYDYYNLDWPLVMPHQ
ncbi:MAG: hypothetical protein FJ090_12800 [Deltaproteobacteria bacterium]|nr:hypothetical protein [Deltaproteobacteria bacterium]